MSEDLPDPENRITLTSNGNIRVHWRPNNRVTHEKLIRAASRLMREAGYPLILVQRMGIETNSHQLGTLRFGDDPSTAVLDPFCKTYDLDNFYVVDSSFFPSSAAMNPALTIAAQALRVADHILGVPQARSESTPDRKNQPSRVH
jgi:choline dehydrogenase-like flavoprotein